MPTAGIGSELMPTQGSLEFIAKEGVVYANEFCLACGVGSVLFPFFSQFSIPPSPQSLGTKERATVKMTIFSHPSSKIW